jgi:hypothetical protein
MSTAAVPWKSTPASSSGGKTGRRSIAQELGLVVVVLLLGTILAIYGWRDAAPGRPNTFLSFDNHFDRARRPLQRIGGKERPVKNQSPPDVKVIDPLTLVTKENVDSNGSRRSQRRQTE